MVLKQAAWLKATGYYKTVNFIYLIVGHTKNAADHLFYSFEIRVSQTEHFHNGGVGRKINYI
jgi:hypothetical protein